MSLSVSDPEILRRAIESRLGDLYTILPGRVETYYPAEQTADVAPVVKRPISTTEGDVVFEDLPIVPNVPVCFPRGGAISLSWKIEKGDHVLLLFSTYALSQWRKTGDTSEPADLRLHHLANAVAIPSLAPNGQAFSESRASENCFTVVGPLIKLGTEDASDFAALASKCNSNFDAIANLFSSWTPVPNDGGAALKTLTASLSFENVACERVKIK